MQNSFLRKMASVVLIASLLGVYIVPSTYAVAYPVEGSFTTTVVSAGQVGRGEIKARATIQLGDANGSMPFFDGPNATNTCGARYSYFLGTNQTVIYDCVSPTYTSAAARSNSNFILVDAYSRNPPAGGFGPDVYTLRTPTEIASAIAALGTNGDYSLSANGRQISYTRIAPETDPNGSTISPVQLSHGAQYLSHDTYASSRGYPAIPNLYSQVDFTPTNVGTGETYEMTISVYIRDQFSLGYNLFDTKAYTATGTTVDDITSRIVAEYNTILYPIPSDPNWVVPLRVHPAINCVDNTTKITCTSNDYAVSIVGSARVIYSTPDTTNPTISLLGTNPEIVTYGTVYTDAGASWTDNRDGAGTITTATSGSVDTAVRGIYTLEYTKIDNAGNTGSVTRTVNVRDTTPPVITVLGSGSVTQELDLPYTDAGATWSDDVDGSGTLTASGISLMTGRGTYTLTYQKIDAAGNIGTGSRNVTIVDTIAPVVTLTTLPVTVDASIYQISGRALGSNFIDVYSGSTLLVSTTPVDGYFSVFVPLAPSSANTFLIEATDTGRNTGTGQVVITTSSASSGFTGAFQVSGSTLSGVTTFSGASFSVATQVTVQAPILFTSSSGGTSVIPTGTVITGASGTVFDASAINALSVTVTGGLASNQTSNGALEFGISGTGLYFSRPIKIQIPVSGYSGTTIPVRVKHGGTSTYVTSGLTSNPNSTCTNGVSSSPSAIATVSGGFATIYTCAASTFVAYTETVVSTGGGSGGGGGGGGSYIATPLASTGTTIPSVTPVITSLVSSSGGVTTITTSLPDGTRVLVSVVSKKGKKSRVIVTRVKDGKVTFKTRKIGTFQVKKIGK